jgi:hypothetical protein
MAATIFFKIREGTVCLKENDTADISGYAADSVAALVRAGLVHGYENGIHPKEATTRAESAVLLYNLYND